MSYTSSLLSQATQPSHSGSSWNLTRPSVTVLFVLLLPDHYHIKFLQLECKFFMASELAQSWYNSQWLKFFLNEYDCWFLFSAHIKHYKKYTSMSYLFFSFFFEALSNNETISKASKEKQTQLNSQLPLERRPRLENLNSYRT